MDEHGIVYKATCKVNGKVYIGKTTKTLEQRKKAHLKLARNPTYYFHTAIRKYGADNFLWECVLFDVPTCDLSSQEIACIAKYRAFDKRYGYNTTMGGDGGKWIEETKKKQSERLRGQKVSEETRELLRRLNTGRKHTEGAIEKIRAAGRRPCKEETKRKIQLAQIGKPKSSAFVRAMKERRATQETRRKQSAARDLILYPMPSRKGCHISDKQKKILAECSKKRWDEWRLSKGRT